MPSSKSYHKSPTSKSQASNNPSKPHHISLYEELYHLLPYLIPCYAIILSIAFYDFSPLAGWYMMHNYRLPSYSTGSLTSLSSNPFLSSIPAYEFNIMDIFSPALPSYDHIFSSYHHLVKPNRMIQYMKSYIDVMILHPADDSLTSDAWLQWSVRGKGLHVPEKLGMNIDADDVRLRRSFMLNVQLDRVSLNIPNAYMFDYQINGLTMEMKVDLDTYNISHGAHEVRISILMLESPYTDLGNITASSATVFYYIPKADMDASTDDIRSGRTHTGDFTLPPRLTSISASSEIIIDPILESDVNIMDASNYRKVASSARISTNDHHYSDDLHLHHDYHGRSQHHDDIYFSSNTRFMINQLDDGDEVYRGDYIPSHPLLFSSHNQHDDTWKGHYSAPMDGIVYITNKQQKPFEFLSLDKTSSSMYAISLPIDRPSTMMKSEEQDSAKKMHDESEL